MSRPLRVLCVDGSAAMRAVLVGALSGGAGIEVVGSAKDGEEALALAAALRPDLVTMDLGLPGKGGLEAIRNILRDCPSRILIVTAAEAEGAWEGDFRALEAGALDLLTKPKLDGPEALERWGQELRDKVRALGELPLPAAGRAGFGAAPSPGLKKVDYFALVASTGGPPLLGRLLASLRGKGMAVLVAQHIAPGFSEGLRRWLAGRCGLEVLLAAEGMAAAPGRVYLAPDGSDLVLDREGRLRCPASPGGVCPSGDRLLQSLAQWAPTRSAAAVLTGMGRDGLAGLSALREAGGLTLAQDPQSCVVDGMPKEAFEKGAASRRVTPDELSLILQALSLLA